MHDLGKRNLLGVAVDAVDYTAAVEAIIAAAHARQPMAVSALAVHGVMTGVRDSAHRFRLNSFDLVVPDGQPVRWALNLLHSTRLKDRVYGPTLMQKICSRAAAERLPIYLYGSRLAVLKALERNLLDRFPGLTIAGSEPSRFRHSTEEEARTIAREIRDSGAAITFAGLGCPRQEVWAYEYREGLSMPIIAVGAAFDFHAGLLRQAPPVLQRYGLEWLFRLVQEPRRLWRRYVYLNPAYAALVAMQLLRLRAFDTSNATPPNGYTWYA